MDPHFIFKDESYKILGACIEVYKEKGNGFLESVYQECLGIEFMQQAIPFVEEPRIHLNYKGQQLHHEFEPDFLYFNEIIVEIKAIN